MICNSAKQQNKNYAREVTMPEINTGIVISLTYRRKYKKILKFVKNYNASNI